MSVDFYFECRLWNSYKIYSNHNKNGATTAENSTVRYYYIPGIYSNKVTLIIRAFNSKIRQGPDED